MTNRDQALESASGADAAKNGAQAPRDYVYKRGTPTISSKLEVMQGVERAVQCACEVVRWQELAGDDPGSDPSKPPTAFEEAELAQMAPAKAEEVMTFRAHASLAFEKVVDLFRESMQDRWCSALINNIEAMDLSDGQASVDSVLRCAQETACETTLIPADLAAGMRWRKSFGQAVQGRPKSGRAVRAHLNIMTVAVDFPEDEITENDDIAFGSVNMLQQGDPDLTADGLITHPKALQALAQQLLTMSALDKNAYSGAVIIPRLFTHKEFESVSMQSLAALPIRMVEMMNAGVRSYAIGDSIAMFLKDGPGSMALSDVNLIAQSTAHFLVAIVYTQADDPLPGGLWPEGVTEEGEPVINELLSLAMEPVREGDANVGLCGLKSFFMGLREGVRWQRGEALVEQVESLMNSRDLKPEECFYSLDTTALSRGHPEINVRIFDGWMNEIADLSWPLLTFDGPPVQAAHAEALMRHWMKFRPRSDFIYVGAEGRA